MCSQPTISYSPDYKTFKFNAKNEGMREAKAVDKKGLVEHDICDVRSEDCGLTHNPPPDEKENGNVTSKALEVTEDNFNGNHKGEHTCAPNNSEDNKRRKSQLTRKGSMECELPELVVFFQESSYNFVKDMSIDKKFPSKEKCLVDSCVLESDADRQSKPVEQTMEPLSSFILKASKPTDQEKDHGDDGTKQLGFTNLVTEDLDSSASDGISFRKATKEIIPESQLVVQKVQKSALTIDNNKNKDTSQTSSVTILKEVKSGKSSCGSDLATTSGTEEPPLGAVCHQQLAETGHTTRRHENEISQSFTEQGQSHQKYCNEEPTHPSGRMSHQVSASPSFRSTSHRSNSSTTSSRSFAFPILAAEWHGSPEQMVKPEKRPLKKRQGKCCSILCCKF
ncbi:hypothetical protein CsatA_001482 [Cannabis sativa]